MPTPGVPGLEISNPEGQPHPEEKSTQKPEISELAGSLEIPSASEPEGVTTKSEEKEVEPAVKLPGQINPKPPAVESKEPTKSVSSEITPAIIDQIPENVAEAADKNELIGGEDSKTVA